MRRAFSWLILAAACGLAAAGLSAQGLEIQESSGFVEARIPGLGWRQAVKIEIA